MQFGIDIVTVLLSATLLVLPIEDGRFWPVAFIALVPLLLRMWSRSNWAIFWLGFSSFFLYLFYSLQWLDATGFHWRVVLVFMNAVSYGVVFAVAFWLMRRYRGHLYATILPTILTLLGFKQTLGFLSFPWPLLCHSQCENLALIQIAAVTGCWGVTFLLVHVNEALAHLMAGGFRPRILPVAVSPVVLICLFGLYGAFALARTPPPADIPVTLVQGSLATNVPWSAEFARRLFDEYSEQTIGELSPDRAAGQLSEPESGPRLVIWPETSIPNAVRSQRSLNEIQALASAFDATFLVGCLTWDPAERVPLDTENLWRLRDEYREHNSLVAFEPDGTVVPMYSKVHMVPFGEVIPLKEIITGWFPDYPWGAEDISPGTGFHVTSTRVGRIGAVICYESFYPQLARSMAANGAELLVLVSNTSWFGRSNAGYHHARFDVYRAVENGIWFCRAATTGVSSIVDPRGKVWVETELFKSDAVTVPVALRSGTTLYTRWGDWVPGLCGVYLLLLLLGGFLIREEEVAED